MTSDTYPVICTYDSEKTFKDVSTGKETEFPSITEAPTRLLSVIVPAYNEESRCK